MSLTTSASMGQALHHPDLPTIENGFHHSTVFENYHGGMNAASGVADE